MSNYEPIVPTSNPFDFHGASIEIETDKEWRGGVVTLLKEDGVIQNRLPRIFVGIKSDKQLIINRCDFTAILTSSNYPAQVFTIESSIDGKHFNVLYTGTTPKVSKYVQFPYSCEFNPTHCKYIRCTFSSTTHEIYSFWGRSFKFYGALLVPFLYTNPDAYGIRKKEK